ncbi:hypothetical protein [Pseudomonas sp. DWP1b1]|uniref:hypothetical protein n=1 Tax=unclassified Pseudomonas TaxID=196821 RepID=UPI003CEC9653
MAMSKLQLKELVRRVVVAQGNTFIKDLLRDNGTRIGVTKDDFSNNLNAAIDEDVITQAKLEAWLAEVEGWGDQHLYLFQAPETDAPALAAGIAASPHARALDAGVSLDFPEGLDLKQISLGRPGLSMEWHQSKEGWNRWTPRDYVVEEGLQRFRFDAYRQRFDRSVVRFEWDFTQPYCAILIHRNPDIDHAVVFTQVTEALWAIGCPAVSLVQISFSQAVKVAARDDHGVHSTRYELDSGYVEMASTLAEGGIESVAAVRGVLHAVDASQFTRAQGMLHFAPEDHGTTRRIPVQVYGSEGRLRIGAQCKREDVFKVVETLWDYNNQP